MRGETYNQEKAVKAQEKFCKKHDAPFFAPKSNCYRCKRNIYQEGGVSVEQATTELITGCPFCCWSYCD